MKTFLGFLAVLSVFGVGFGVFVAQVSTKPFTKPGQEAEAAERIRMVKQAAAAHISNGQTGTSPRAVCEHPAFEFGLMDPLTVGSHTFVIKNTGSAPLKLQGGASSCKCTLSDLDSAELAPGESYPVKLVWNSGHASRAFQQSAVVRTNDPGEPEIQLTVQGQVKAVVAATTSGIQLDRLIPETTKSAQATIYSQVWGQLPIDRLEVTSEFITARLIDAADATDAVFFDDEIRNATAIQNIEVTYDGNAPAGPLSALLRIYVRPPADWIAKSADQQSELDSAGKQPPKIALPQLDDGTVLYELPIVGTVVNRLGLYGPNVKSDGLVELGKVTASESKGKSWIIVARLRGEGRPDSLKVEVTGIPGLRATVDNTSTSAAKNSYRIQLELTEHVGPKIFQGSTQGTLRVQTEGWTVDETLELPIELDVL